MPAQLSPYSVWSLVTAILGFICLSFGGVGTLIGLGLGLLAIVLGGLAIRDITFEGSSARGTSLALLGIVVGGILLLLSAYKFTATGCAPMNAFKGMYEKAGEMPE